MIPKPVGAQIVVKPLSGDEMTRGGVLLPDEVRTRAKRGMIVAVGPGFRKMFETDEPEYIPLDLREGDTIIWNRHEGVGIEVEGEELLVLHAHDVLVVLEEAPDRAGVR